LNLNLNLNLNLDLDLDPDPNPNPNLLTRPASLPAVLAAVAVPALRL
jgi:hypothetical protein